MTKSKNEEQYVKICPKCGSIDVKVDFSNPAVWAYGTTVKYKCNSCGHMRPTFPEVLENKVIDFKKRLKQEIKEGKIKHPKEDLIDASTGFWAITYQIAIILVILIIVLFIAGVYFINRNTTTSIILIILGILVLIWLIQAYNKYRIK